MKLTTKTALSIAVISAGLMLTNSLTTPAESNTSAAPVGKTGSPGDGSNCTSCHSGTASTVAGLITSTIPASGYVPGQTYTITASVTQAGKTKFGFEISPQNATGTQMGTLIVTSPTLTQLVGTGKYITHKTAGTAFSSGTALWSFDWTAPIAGSGAVVFYGAFNITNSSGSTAGDIIKLSTLTIQEDASIGINEMYASDDNITVYPNPLSDKLYVKSNEETGYFNLSITDVQGKIILKAEKQIFEKSIDLSNVAEGLYFVRIDTEKGSAVKRIIKK